MSSGRTAAPASLASLVVWLDSAPPGTTLSAESLRAILAPLAVTASEPPAPAPIVDPGATWRERVWTVAQDTRLGVREAAEAVGRPVSWVYRHTSAKTGLSILPHRKLDGELVFVAGELRTWLRENEETIEVGRVTSTLSLSARRAS